MSESERRLVPQFTIVCYKQIFIIKYFIIYIYNAGFKLRRGPNDTRVCPPRLVNQSNSLVAPVEFWPGRWQNTVMQKLTAVIYPDVENDWLAAHHPETGTTTATMT
jgi:hypothetical protein